MKTFIIIWSWPGAGLEEIEKLNIQATSKGDAMVRASKFIKEQNNGRHPNIYNVKVLIK